MELIYFFLNKGDKDIEPNIFKLFFPRTIPYTHTHIRAHAHTNISLCLHVPLHHNPTRTDLRLSTVFKDLVTKQESI